MSGGRPRGHALRPDECFPRKLAAWAARRGLGVHIEGIDLSPIAVEEAKAKSHAFANISFTSCDLFDLPAGNLYDIVHSTLVLHHFNGESAARALQKMHALARHGVVVNDLHRHPAAYYAILAFLAFIAFLAVLAFFWGQTVVPLT